MNLKVRFLLLIIGSFFIPNILIMLILWLSFGGVDNMRSTHDQFDQYYRLYEYISTDTDRDTFLGFIENLPDGMNARLLDSEKQNGQLIFTELIEENKYNEDNKITLEALAVSFQDGTASVLVINRPLADKYSIFRNSPFRFMFPFVLFSVVTVLSLFLIRSINSSLRKIEEATRKVAEGDFDFELKAKGNDSIASLTRSFNIMRLKVQDEYDRRARFFMGVSHDLKTPLASISGYADAVLEGYAEDKETLDKYMAIIKDKSTILKERISHLINFVKLENGDWKTSLEPVKLKPFISALSNSFSIEAGIYKFNYISKIDLDDNISIDMDQELVTRSMENLMHNAFRYSYTGSIISFTVYKETGYILLGISNQSEGIPEDEIPNIFEPFYRGSKGRNDEGFGLGLANVAAVIKSHGWEITVESDLKKETTFTIKIPILKK
ncbi:MAG: HAMP domain-containing histidine kinase [Spirochaetales bacterium]|nr:HAMP domain-containing histidine kinase [Spirochaetales bacterium]